ncbi:hypothetical protein [Bradyrhizobium sp. I71]|uniref:hypothetical protein n=1 Tax=Bradyrhizobium sp. I71 TaxID=2590772 RepID=UPI001EF9287C|nr:hypothetical protein [Bradyrhizobium sp. I71]ULK98831.1 hypothetical protein FJV43_03540 [Bradyrhizobium sp. I71]
MNGPGQRILVDAASMRGELHNVLLAVIVIAALAFVLVAIEWFGWRALVMTLLIAAPVLMCLVVAGIAVLGPV